MDVFNYMYFFLLNRMTTHDKTIYRVLAMVEKFYYIHVIGMVTKKPVYLYGWDAMYCN